MLHLHRFLIVVSRVIVNHDGRGGTATVPLGMGSRAELI